MSDREELEELRRLAELESRAGNQREAADMAAKGTSVGDALKISAGRTADKIVSGVDQAIQWARLLPKGPRALSAAGGTPPELQDQARRRLGELKTEQEEKDTAYAGLQRERPVASAVGASLPYAATAAAAPSLGLLASSGLIGAGSASEYGSPRERATHGALSFGTGLAGGMVGNAIAKAIAPVRPGALSNAQSTALNSMDNMGVRPRLSEVTGSPFIRGMEDWAARTPGGSGVMRNFAQGNQQAVNQTAARSIGTNADELTPAVFAETSHRLGRVFEGIKNLPGRPIQISQKVGTVADDILRQQGKMIPTQQDANLIAIANQAKQWSHGRGKIDGESYQLIRSGLSEASYDASGTNRALYGKLLEALDDAADASLRTAGQGKLADALKTVRPQYANLKTLEKGAVAEAGNVSPARLASALRTNNPAAFREGRLAGNPLYDIARVGEAFKPLQQGSQTYERTLLSNPLATTLAAGPAYAAARLTTSPAAQFYPRYIGNTQAAGLLADAANPAVRAGMMGLLQPPASAFLLPIMAE